MLAAIPVLLAPALLFMLAEGWVDAGGGEKDILLVIPYFIWALMFFLIALFLIIRRWPLRRWIIRSASIATFVLFLMGSVAYLSSWLGLS